MRSFVLSAFLHIILFSMAIFSAQAQYNQAIQVIAVPVELITKEPMTEQSPAPRIRKPKQKPAENVKSDHDYNKFLPDEGQTVVNLHEVGADRNQVFGYLVSLIYKNRIYPYESIRLHEQGKVTVSFYINEHGEVTNITIIAPSNHKKLNSAAIKTLQSLNLNKKFPQIETLFDQQYSFTFDFEIT